MTLDFEINNTQLVKYHGTDQTVVVPNGVTCICSNAFTEDDEHFNYTIKKIVLPQSVSVLEHGAFGGCEALEQINLPEGILEIPYRTFYGCSSLKSIVIPDGVYFIGSAAFKFCSSLTEIYIPKSVIEISYDTFSFCEGLADENGFVIFDSKLYGYYGGKEEVTVPDGVKFICSHAFDDLSCANIKTIHFPESVEEIDDLAFTGCSGMADENGWLVIDGTLYVYDDMYQRLCDHDHTLHEAVIPEGVTVISEAMYFTFDIYKVEVLRLPKSLEEFDDYCLLESKTLKEVYLSNSVYYTTNVDHHNYIVQKIDDFTDKIIVTNLKELGPRALHEGDPPIFDENVF